MEKIFSVAVGKELLYEMCESEYLMDKTDFLIGYLENIEDDYAQYLRQRLITEMKKITGQVYHPEHNEAVDDIMYDILTFYPLPYLFTMIFN